jgi:hypothetical protein
MLKTKALMQLLPGLASSMGFPLPPGLDIEQFIGPDEHEDETKSINPFDTIRKLKFLSQLNDKDFRRLFMRMIMSPDNTVLSNNVLNAVCVEAAKISKLKE